MNDCDYLNDICDDQLTAEAAELYNLPLYLLLDTPQLHRRGGVEGGYKQLIISK